MTTPITLNPTPTDTTVIQNSERSWKYDPLQGVYLLQCCCSNSLNLNLICNPLESLVATNDFTGFTHYYATSQPYIDTEAVTYSPTGGNPSTTGYLRCSLAAQHGIKSFIFFPSTIYIPKGGTLLGLSYSVDIQINTLATQICYFGLCAMQLGHVYFMGNSPYFTPTGPNDGPWQTYTVSTSYSGAIYVGEVPTVGNYISTTLSTAPIFDPSMVIQFGLMDVDAQNLYSGGTYITDLSIANFNLNLTIGC